MLTIHICIHSANTDTAATTIAIILLQMALITISVAASSSQFGDILKKRVFHIEMRPERILGSSGKVSRTKSEH